MYILKYCLLTGYAVKEFFSHAFFIKLLTNLLSKYVFVDSEIYEDYKKYVSIKKFILLDLRHGNAFVKNEKLKHINICNLQQSSC